MGCSLLSIIEIVYFTLNAFAGMFRIQRPKKKFGNYLSNESNMQALELKILQSEENILKKLKALNKRIDLMELKNSSELLRKSEEFPRKAHRSRREILNVEDLN